MSFIPVDQQETEKWQTFAENLCEDVIAIIAQYDVPDECVEEIRELFEFEEEH